MLQRMTRFPLLATLVLAVAGCTDRLTPPDVAGTYILESVNGTSVPLPGIYAQSKGSITLKAPRLVERRISYTIDDQGTVREEVASGTFELSDSVLHLALQAGTYVWTPSAYLTGSTIRLQYPSPVDGPDVVELYRLH